jgi:putative salt-induced outer membrane protein
MVPRSLKLLVPVSVLVWSLAGTAALAEDAPKRPWENTTELGFVTTTGNTQTENISVKNTYKYKWTGTRFQFDASMLRAEQTDRTASNVGGDLIVEEMTTTNAEAYRLATKLSHDLTKRLFTYGTVSWERDRFAGIESRYVAGAGLGYQVIKTDTSMLAFELGLDYTDEQTVGADDGDSFAGMRAAMDYEWKFSETARLNQDLEFLENLEETSDYRINSLTSVTAALTSKLALKTSYTIKYDNEPVVEALTAVGFDPVMFEFDKTDTILSASLVINF